jgi:excisionase family DNA binding protein
MNSVSEASRQNCSETMHSLLRWSDCDFPIERIQYLSPQSLACRDVREGKHVSVRDLKTHPEPYVTVAELAEYWLVGRKQIYKQIDAGTLPAIRLGPRLLRIRTADAIEFEQSANMQRPASHALRADNRPVKRSAQLRQRS